MWMFKVVPGILGKLKFILLQCHLSLHVIPDLTAWCWDQGAVGVQTICCRLRWSSCLWRNVFMTQAVCFDSFFCYRVNSWVILTTSPDGECKTFAEQPQSELNVIYPFIYIAFCDGLLIHYTFTQRSSCSAVSPLLTHPEYKQRELILQET